MPTYEYRCEAGHDFEVVQRITEDALRECQVCGAKVHRVVFPVGVVFKGQGFYKTDSRSASGSSILPPKSTSGEEKSDGAAAPATPAKAGAPAKQSEKASVSPTPAGGD